MLIPPPYGDGGEALFGDGSHYLPPSSSERSPGSVQRPASSFLTVGSMKKSTGAISGEKCRWMPWISRAQWRGCELEHWANSKTIPVGTILVILLHPRAWTQWTVGGSPDANPAIIGYIDDNSDKSGDPRLHMR